MSFRWVRQRLAILLKDLRVFLQYDEIWKAASAEFLWVASFEDSVMRSLADVAEVEAVEFKSSVIAAAHLSYHFMWRRVLITCGLWRVVISRKT